MKKNDSTGVAGVVFGIAFAIMGVLLLVKSASTVVMAISIVDIGFGIVLFVSGVVMLIRSKRQGSAGDFDADIEDDQIGEVQHAGYPAPFEDSIEDNNAFTLDDEEPFRHGARDRFSSRNAAPMQPQSEPKPVESAEQSPEDRIAALARREAALRNEAKRTAADANRAAADADAAIESARVAEERLNRAELQSRELIGVEQQNALRRIDKLANEAMELSREAAVARKRAKTAAGIARRAREEYIQAMDEVAEAMLAAEEDEFD